MIKPVPEKELLKIAAALEDYHKIFYTFWEMSDVLYDDSLPTAAVEFLKGERKPRLLINEEFWKKLNHRERLFVACHECLHVILDHGQRNGREVKGSTPHLVNVAQDITINEMIVDVFGYERKDFRKWKDLCWIDTCFDDPTIVKRNQKFTYYLEMLIKHGKKDLPKVFDRHQPSQSDEKKSGSQPSDPKPSPGDPKSADPAPTGEEESQEQRDARQSAAEKLAADLSPEEIHDIMEAGELGGDLAAAINAVLGDKKERARVRFAKMVARLKRTRMKLKESEFETFSRDDRRFDDVVRSYGAVLPGKGEAFRPAKDRILAYVYMDVSMSCVAYLPIFEKIWAAFDAEKDIFECETYIFDTKVTPHKPGDDARVGGGTWFNIIEESVLGRKAETGRYPDAVFVITDGDCAPSTAVDPLVPERWVWLLIDRAELKYIPKGSRWYWIKDVVF